MPEKVNRNGLGTIVGLVRRSYMGRLDTDMAPGNDVLVVEDDAMLNRVFCQFVKLAGFAYRFALDGGSAMRAVEEKQPKLILLDLMLPDTTGFEICTALKKDERTRAITVVMVTAMGDAESRQRGMESGAADYLVKPVDADQLMDIVRKYAA